jgi:two-component system, OmpR family, sensor kinase
LTHSQGSRPLEASGWSGRRRLSLRATLLIGYALGVGLVLAVFGVVAQQHYWRTLVADLDAELAARARTIAGSVAIEPDGQFDITLPDEILTFFLAQRDAYYVLRAGDGSAIDFSTPEALQTPPLAPASSRTRGGVHEVAVAGPHRTTVVVGRALRIQQARYDEFVRTLRVAGAAGLVLAVGSAWLLVRRAVAPIERIGRTAEAMSAENLDLRIDMRETESELGRVAAALNGAFDRLQAAFERQTRFTADASHELRTPLTTVVSESEWALRRARSPEEYRQAFATCLRAAERMRAVVEDLLALARADAGRAAFEQEPVDLADVARDVLALVASRAAAADVSLDARLEPAIVTGDRDRLRELVHNLVHNAVQYNRAHGLVRVSTCRSDGRVRVEVHDTGMGIAPADLPHVFDRFYRADAARSRAVGGSGLGLAIARGIAEAHGGAIEVRSSPATGTTFTARFPDR